MGRPRPRPRPRPVFKALLQGNLPGPPPRGLCCSSSCRPAPSGIRARSDSRPRRRALQGGPYLHRLKAARALWAGLQAEKWSPRGPSRPRPRRCRDRLRLRLPSGLAKASRPRMAADCGAPPLTMLRPPVEKSKGGREENYKAGRPSNVPSETRRPLLTAPPSAAEGEPQAVWCAGRGRSAARGCFQCLTKIPRSSKRDHAALTSGLSDSLRHAWKIPY